MPFCSASVAIQYGMENSINTFHIFIFSSCRSSCLAQFPRIEFKKKKCWKSLSTLLLLSIRHYSVIIILYRGDHGFGLRTLIFLAINIETEFFFLISTCVNRLRTHAKSLCILQDPLHSVILILYCRRIICLLLGKDPALRGRL